MTTLPLEGIKVLDLTRWLAGPMATSLMGDLGAEVIKVEPLPNGDLTRLAAPFVGGEAAYFLSVNRNKRSIAIQFRHPQAKEIIRRLALTCDVLAENFKVGVMERMGFPYKALAQENPRLIYGAFTSYGLTGPYKDRPGVDQIAQGMGGFTGVTGFDRDTPVRAGVPISDLTTGMFGALAIVAALHERNQTGRGRLVEVSLLESTLGLMCFQAQKYLSLGQVPEPQGNSHPLLTPCGTFPTKNGPLNLCTASGDHWRILCDLLGAPELAEDPRFVDNTVRRQHRDELTAILNDHLKERTKEEWTEALNRVGIPAGPLYTMEEIFRDPHVQARGIVETVTHSTLGSLPLVRSPLRVEGMERSVRLPPPVLGEHTREVLEDLGYSDEEARRLLDQGVALQAAIPVPERKL